MTLQNKLGLLFVISAPAGTGKTTLVNMLTKDLERVKQSISFTTREPRPNEIDHVHYHFVDKLDFERRIQEGDFLEFAKVYEDYYGTSLSAVNEERKKGHHVILVIDTQGALQLKNKVDAVFIFIKPPSVKVLRERLVSRCTETESRIEERLVWAEKELEAASIYDYEVVNDQLEKAYEVLKSIVIAEEHRIRK